MQQTRCREPKPWGILQDGIKRGLPKIVLGMGTGRCGSWTLANILMKQKGTVCTHEGLGLAWEPDYLAFYETILNFLVNFKADIIANVGWYWINYVGRLMNTLEDPKCICLKRPKDEVVHSFQKYMPKINHWTDPASIHWKPRKYSIDMDRHMWPKYDAPRAEAIAIYWEEYYATAEFWQQRLPDNFLIIDMQEALNTEDGQHRMLSHIGYQEKDHEIFLNQKLNTPDKHAGNMQDEYGDIR